jgi:hypothetical protein
MSSELGIWLAAILTLAIYSFLYKDNPVYRFAESLLVGVSVGFLLVVTFDTTLVPKAVDPLVSTFPGIINGGKFLDFLFILIPVVLGLLMFARFVPRFAWLSRIALALYTGFGAGASIPANMQSLILKQIEATIRPFLTINSAWGMFNAIIILIGLISTICYFFFSKAHTGKFGKVARLGTYFLMIFFGATFGYTVMARISLLIGRLTFLLKDWLGLLS